MKSRAILLAAALAATFTSAAGTGPSQGVSRTASGSFDVQAAPLDEKPFADGISLGRYSLAKQYHGDLDAEAEGEMLTATTPIETSAGYVAMERVDGTLDGRRGTFVLQHLGVMSQQEGQNLSITVVPDSGTGELTGLAGTLHVRITEEGHFYDFEYTLPE